MEQPKEMVIYQFDDMHAWLKHTTPPVHSSSSAEQAKKKTLHHQASNRARSCPATAVEDNSVFSWVTTKEESALDLSVY